MGATMIPRRGSTRGVMVRLCDIGHILMENSNGLAVDGGVNQAGGTAEREAALAML